MTCRYRNDGYSYKQNQNRIPINSVRYDSVSLLNGNCRGLSVNYEKKLACAYFENNEILVLLVWDVDC